MSYYVDVFCLMEFYFDFVYIVLKCLNRGTWKKSAEPVHSLKEQSPTTRIDLDMPPYHTSRQSDAELVI